jgi:glycosidase
LNPNAYTTAEIWSNAAEFVKKGGFSASMNYNAFAIPVTGFLIDNNVAPTKFGQLLESRRKQFPPPVAAVMQNLTDSHDTDRIASMIVNGPNAPAPNGDDIVFNKNNNPGSSDTYEIRKPNERERDLQRLIVLFQMCYLGAPMIYYGDETGMWGATDPDDRMPMVWQDRQYEPQAIDPRGREREPDEVKCDPQLFDFYKRAIALRRQHDALNHGEFAILAADDAQRVIITTRRSRRESLIIAVNRGSEDAHVDLRVNATSLTPIFVTRGELEAVKAQGSQITLPALTAAVFSAN